MREATVDGSATQRILVLGATGATGRLLVETLLNRGIEVKAVVRSPDRLPKTLREHPLLQWQQINLLELDHEAMIRLVEDCDSAASCLGHNLTWKGVFGPPYRLVTEATRRLATAMQVDPGDNPARLVLMSSTGVRDRPAEGPGTWGERIVLGILRLLVPPHADNEQAAAALHDRSGPGVQGPEWCIVRPDTLSNAEAPETYEVFPSPIRSAIFDAGHTSRRNVARFIADLLTDEQLWEKWKGRMPVVYDAHPQ